MYAYEFLKHLDATTDTFCFQVFPEANGATSSFHQHGSLHELGETFRKLNASGCGISVCINETDGKGRKKENITRIRAVWHDDDVGGPITFPLEPSLIVGTSQGRYHYYWLVEEAWPADEAGCSDFQAIMQCMVQKYGADKQATDISRVMRVPGFNHVKGEPWLVEIVHYGPSYTRQQLLDGYGIDNKTGQIVVPAGPPVIEAPPTAPEFETENEPLEDEGGDDSERIEDALKHIPAEPRDHWLAVGMALHHETAGTEEGFALWDDWSRGTNAGNYNDESQQRSWSNFDSNRSDATTIASLFKLAKDHGWRDPVRLPGLADIPQVPLHIPRRDNDLVVQTMRVVRKEFATIEHHPSARHLAGLAQVATVIQAMAENHPALERNIYLSFLPPGIGKTTTAVHAIRNLVAMEEYRQAGVIFFLSRVEEIGKLAKAMELSEHEFSVIVSASYKEKDLGNADKTKARVLFTTQQMLLSRLRHHSSFAEIADFQWNGSPRQVRIWDEAISPVLPLTINSYQLADLVFTAEQEAGSEFAELIEQTRDLLRQSSDQATIKIPDIATRNISLDTMRSWYDRTAAKNAIEILFRLSGQKVRVRKDVSNAAVHYASLLPNDLGPLLVLDASGQFRKIYEFWHRSRQSLTALLSPQKNYAGLIIHHWDRGTGRQSRQSKGNELITGIVKAIHSIPAHEPVLVVHHKQKSRAEPDWEREIRAEVKRDNLHCCNWGRHTATNDYQACRHVILAGALQYATSQCEALARGAKEMPVDDDLSEGDLQATRISEMAHNIFQAACRGQIRRSERDGCPPGCHLYVIGSSHRLAGVTSELLEQIFPGATVQAWEPVIKLSGKTRALYDVLSEFPDEVEIPKKELSGRLGIKNDQQLSALLARDDLQQTMEAGGRKLELKRGRVIIHRAAPEGVYDKNSQTNEWFWDIPF